MEIIIGFLAGLVIASIAGIIYLSHRIKKIENGQGNVQLFKKQLEDIKTVTKADEILANIKTFEKHVADLGNVVLDNNKLIIGKFKEHEVVLVDQQKTINVIADNLKKLSDYVANKDN